MCELERDLSELDSLREQLAKANERVRELESIVVAITHADETGYVDGEGFISNWSEISEEAKSLLNKFAIEQQQAAINSIKDKWIKKASEMPLGLECRSKASSCYNWAMYYAKELTDEAEQLRKEQE